MDICRIWKSRAGYDFVRLKSRGWKISAKDRTGRAYPHLGLTEALLKKKKESWVQSSVYCIAEVCTDNSITKSCTRVDLYVYNMKHQDSQRAMNKFALMNPYCTIYGALFIDKSHKIEFLRFIGIFTSLIERQISSILLKQSRHRSSYLKAFGAEKPKCWKHSQRLQNNVSFWDNSIYKLLTRKSIREITSRMVSFSLHKIPKSFSHILNVLLL